MKEFRLRVADRTYTIGMDPSQMMVEGHPVNWEIVEVAGNRFTVAIDGIHYEVELRESAEGQTIAVVDGNEYPVEATGLVRGRPAVPEKRARPAAPTAEAVEGALTAMMPSKVIAVYVKVGDEVQADQVVLILEAMKMESELKAPQDGTVTAVNCAAGDSVEPGVPLVVIE